MFGGDSLRRNALWQLLQTIFGTGGEMLILLALASALSPTDFGRYAVAMSLSKIVFLIFEGRLHELLIPKLSRYLGRRYRGAWTWTIWARRIEFMLNTIAFVACVFISLGAPRVVQELDTAMLTAAAAYTWANTFLKFTSIAILRCLEAIRLAAYVSIVSSMLKLIVLMVMLRMRVEIPSLFLVLSAISIAASAALAFIAKFELRNRIGMPPPCYSRAVRPENARQLRVLMASNYGVGMVELFYREMDMQVTALLAGPVVAGRYRLAKTLATTMLEALNPVLLVLLPELSRRMSNATTASLRDFLRRIARILALLGLIMGPSIIFASFIYTKFIAPQHFQVLIPTAILVAFFTFLSPFLWCQAFLVAAGRPHAYLLSSAVGAAVAILSSFYLVSAAGLIGASLAYGFGLTITTVLGVLAVKSFLIESHNGDLMSR